MANRAELLKERAASAEYGLSVHWFRKRRRLRLPPRFIRVERAILYRREDLDNFFLAHEIEPETQEAGR